MPRPTESPTRPETLRAPSFAGTVAAEIGEDRGAAIVHVPPSWTGLEIEIRRPPQPWKGVHVAVLQRRLVGGTEFSAFFPSLQEGEYEVRPRPRSKRRRDEHEGRRLCISAGTVVHLYWSDRPAKAIVGSP